MPACEVRTNVKIPESEAKDFALEFSKFSAETLGKPEKYITTSIIYCPELTFGGSFEPAFTMQVVSLDNINPEANEKYSKAFFDFFHKKLKVSGDRGYITFVDPGRAYLGHEGTTFATIFGK